jgi:hypothetical protein
LSKKWLQKGVYLPYLDIASDVDAIAVRAHSPTTRSGTRLDGVVKRTARERLAIGFGAERFDVLVRF